MTPEQFAELLVELCRFNDNIEQITNVILANHEDERGLVPAQDRGPRQAHHAKAPSNK